MPEHPEDDVELTVFNEDPTAEKQPVEDKEAAELELQRLRRALRQMERITI